MLDLFVYGTLRDPQLRRRVLGALAPPRVLDAAAPGWLAARMPGVAYPILVAASGSRAEGAILARLGSKAVGVLKAFEGPGYRLAELTVETSDGPRRASAFLPTERIVARAGPPFLPWSYEAWARGRRGSGRI